MVSRKKPLVVVDTQLFIYSLFPTPFSRDAIAIFDLEDQGFIQFAFSKTTKNELFKILARTVEQENEFECSEYFEEMVEITKRSCYCDTPAPLPKLSSDKGDQKFIELAVAVNADYLVTHDFQNGLLALGQYASTKIVTARQFLVEMKKMGVIHKV
jgi:predicted nucleic acid-binding protein